MPNQGSPNIMAQATTDAEVEDAYGVSMDQGIEGQQASVEMPYQEFLYGNSTARNGGRPSIR